MFIPTKTPSNNPPPSIPLPPPGKDVQYPLQGSRGFQVLPENKYAMISENNDVSKMENNDV